MEKLRSFQIFTVITMLVGVVYAILLATIWKDVAPETVLHIWNNNGEGIVLPFEVSRWWNLLIFPAIVIVGMYIKEFHALTGSEPRGCNEKVSLKYTARMVLNLVKGISFLFAICMAAGSLVFSPLTGITTLLSFVCIGVIVYFGAYTVLGAWSTLGYLFLGFDFFEEKVTVQTHLVMGEKLIKEAGLIQAFPFLVGLSIALMVRMIFWGLASLRKIKFDVEEEKA